MLDPTVIQLSIVDQNRDIIEKAELLKNTPSNQIKEKQIKDLYLLFASKISTYLNNNEIQNIQDLIIETSRVFSELIHAFDWPALDKKTLERLHRKTNFYYDLIKFRVQVKHKRLNFDNLRFIFDFYRKYLNILGDNEIDSVLLSESLVYQIMADYLNVYQKFLHASYSHDEHSLNEAKEDFWEMPLHVFEGIFLIPADQLLPSDKSEDLKNFNLLNLYSILYKARIIEIETEHYFAQDKSGLSEKLNQKQEYEDRLIKTSSYNQFLMRTYPVLYFDLLVLRVIASYLKLENSKGVIELISELVEAWNFIGIYTKFIRRPNDLNLVKYQFLETVQSLIIILILSVRESFNSQILIEVADFLGFDYKKNQTKRGQEIIKKLKFPFLSTFSNELSKEIISRGVKLNSKVSKNKDELNAFDDNLIKLFVELK